MWSPLILVCCFLSHTFIFTTGNSKVGRTLYHPTFSGPSPLWYSDSMVSHASHLIKSYYQVTGGEELVPIRLVKENPVEASRLLFFLEDRIVVSHGTQSSGDGPILNYGNCAALKRWAASWEELTSMPSKYTAEPINQNTRDEFMKTVTRDGIVQNYSGVRISLDKSRYFYMQRGHR
jgi:hypothetical protein